MERAENLRVPAVLRVCVCYFFVAEVISISELAARERVLCQRGIRDNSEVNFNNVLKFCSWNNSGCCTRI